jgi:hypothetical protein
VKLRLVEEYSVKHDTTSYAVEFKTWNDLWWDRLGWFANEDEAQAAFNRFKKSRGKHWRTKVLDEWNSRE